VVRQTTPICATAVAAARKSEGLAVKFGYQSEIGRRNPVLRASAAINGRKARFLVQT
jgi:hypothetical protein